MVERFMNKTIKKWREKDKYIKDLGYLLKDE